MLEIALAGFSKKELKVYTEYGKLIVEGQKETKETGSEYVHQGLAQRSFNSAWTLSDDLKSEMSRWRMDFLPLSWVK